MSSDHPGDETIPSDEIASAEVVMTPPAEQPIVEDTNEHLADYASETATYSASSRPFRVPGVYYARQTRETKFHQGPFPDPETLREYAAIYPNATKIIFD